MVKVCVDDRESASGIILELEDLGAEVDVRRLAVADFICSGRIGIERKTISDFHSSIFDNPRHLYGQLADLKMNYERPLLLIEGDPEELYTERMVHPNSIRGILCSIAIDMQVPITYTRSVSDTAGFLFNTAKREQEDHKHSLALHGKRSHLGPDEQLIYIMAALPDLGPVKAKALLVQFGSLKKIFNASVEELQETPGIKNMANHIYEIGHRRYHE